MLSISVRSLYSCFSATSVTLSNLSSSPHHSSTSSVPTHSSSSSSAAAEPLQAPPSAASYFEEQISNHRSREEQQEEEGSSTKFFDRSFSSGAFVGDDSSAYARLSRLHGSNNSHNEYNNRYNNNNNNSREAEDPTKRYAALTRPTIETYQGMSNDELTALLKTREEQVKKLRQIYENFHYEVDKHFRKTVLDYHDKAINLGKMHVEMQASSYADQRHVLRKLREEQARMSRDVHIIMFLSGVVVFVFWVWVRRHYIRRADFQNKLQSVIQDELQSSGTGAFRFNADNVFSSRKRSGRSIETSWEKEMRLKQEAQRKVMQEAAAIAAAKLLKKENEASSELGKELQSEQQEQNKMLNIEKNNSNKIRV